MQKPTIPFFLILSCWLFQANSQSTNYQEAELYNLDGTKTVGFIDFQDWYVTPSSIFFKSELNEDSIESSPTQIAGFKVAGQNFVSGKDRESKQSFLRVIVEGKKSLYAHRINSVTEDFYIKYDGEFMWLTFEPAITNEVNNIVMTKANRRFANILSLYFEDCPDMKQSINNSKYNSKSLKFLFKKYYKCSDSTPSFLEEKDPLEWNLGLFAGYGSSVFDSEAYFVRYEESGLTGGVFFEFYIPKSGKKWSIRSELTSGSFSGQATGGFIDELGVLTPRTTLLDFDGAFRMVNLIGKRHLKGSLKGLSLGLGLSNSFIVGGSTPRFTSQGREINSVVDISPFQRSLSFGYIFVTEYQLQRFSLGARHEVVAGPYAFQSSENQSKYKVSKVSSTFKRLSIALSYRILHKE